jgi:hypothetical protein
MTYLIQAYKERLRNKTVVLFGFNNIHSLDLSLSKEMGVKC